MRQEDGSWLATDPQNEGAEAPRGPRRTGQDTLADPRSKWPRQDTPPTPGQDPFRQILLMSWFSTTDLKAPRLATFSIARPTHSVVVTYFGKSNFHTG